MKKQIITLGKRKIQATYLEKPFDKALSELKENGYRIITAKENVELRMETGKDSFISKNGNYVQEGVIYVPKKGIFLTKHPPILKNPKESTEANRNGNEFYITNEQTERALESSVKVPYSQTNISFDEFGDDEITNFLFGKKAKDYGLFLKDAGINEMPLYFQNKDYIDGEGRSFANQLWLCRLGGWAGLGGDGHGLCYGKRDSGG